MPASDVREKLSTQNVYGAACPPSWNETCPVPVVQSSATGESGVPGRVGQSAGVNVNSTCCGVAVPSRTTCCPNAAG